MLLKRLRVYRGRGHGAQDAASGLWRGDGFRALMVHHRLTGYPGASVAERGVHSPYLENGRPPCPAMGRTGFILRSQANGC